MRRREEKPRPAEQEAMELAPAKLDALLEKREREAFAPFVDAGFATSREVVSALGGVSAAAKALEGAKPEGQWSKIGEEMKKNFMDRIPRAVALAAPNEKDYDSLAAFHASAFQAISSVAKILSDNRYLAHFFPREMSEFAKRANAASELDGKLAKALADGRAAAAGFAEARSALANHKALAEEKAALEAELKAMPAEEERKTEPKPAGGSAAERKMKELDARVSSVRASLAAALNPLERPLRKLEKTSLDKRVSAAAALFASDPVGAAIDKGLGEARFVAGELEKELAAGRVESDEDKRTRLAAHLKRIDFASLEKNVSDLRALGDAMLEAEGELRAEKAAQRATEEEESRAEAARRKRAELEEKTKAKGIAAGESLREAEKAAGKARGAGIKMLG